MNTEIIKTSISKSIDYPTYSAIVNAFAKANKTSGLEQTQNYIDYTKLNASRMRRIEKSVQFSDKELEPFKNVLEKQTWLVISETWCGDSAQIIPILNKISKCSSNIDLRLVFRDGNLELMDLFLTNNSRSIPKLILLNKDFEVLTTWGPRPQKAAEMVAHYKLKHGTIDAEFKTELQRWYNYDKGNEILNDLGTMFVHA